MRISLLGDIMLGRKVGETIIKKGNEYVFGEVLPFFKKSDFIIANLEAPFDSDGRKYNGKNPHLTFSISSELISTLKFLKLNGVTLANNHLSDFGLNGIISTTSLLKENRIVYTGAGKDLDEAFKPIILENGIGIMAFNAFVPMCRTARKKSFGVAEFNIENIRYVINKYSTLCSFYILIVHWGIDYYQYPIPGLLNIARQILKEIPQILCVVGHHPHLIQPVLSHSEKNIYLSLGNFIFDEPFPLSRLGAVLHFDIDGTKKIKYESLDFFELNKDYRLIPLSEKKKTEELQRIENIKRGIDLNDSQFQATDRRWIKLLLFNTFRYGSMTALRNLFQTYTIKEVINKMRI